MTIQSVLGLGKTGQFLGQTMTAVSFSNDLGFTYPSSSLPGDIIITYVVAENLVIPTLPQGWTSLYSNIVTAVNGSDTARHLMYRKRGTETFANTTVVGGGNATCVALRGYLGTIANVTEFVANSAIGNTDFTYDINSQQIQLVLVNQDGGANNSLISIANTTSVNSQPGFFKSMAIGYTQVASSNVISVNTSSDSVYGVYLRVF